MNEPIDDRYASFREHSDVRERVTALEGTQVQINATLARIEGLIRAPQQNQNQHVDHASLAIQRAADILERQGKGGTHGQSPVLIGFALIGALAIGGMAAWIIMGQH